MDRIELIKAAWDASDNAVFDSNNWNNYNDGFMKGAEWLMQQPLADRLTDEEKEKIKAIYKREGDSMGLETSRIKNAQSQIVQLCHESNFWQAKLKVEMLESIFGKELFNEK